MPATEAGRCCTMYKVLKREKIIRSPKEVSDLIKLIDKFGLKPVMVDVGDKWICNQNPEELRGRRAAAHLRRLHDH